MRFCIGQTRERKSDLAGENHHLHLLVFINGHLKLTPGISTPTKDNDFTILGYVDATLPFATGNGIDQIFHRNLLLFCKNKNWVNLYN